MVFTKFVELGRVAYIAYGPDKGKLCAIVNVIDQNRAHVDGPAIKRQSMNFKAMVLLPNVIKKMTYGCRKGRLLKLWQENEIDRKWEKSTFARKLSDKEKRANLTDFERFKLMKAKQSRNHLINREYFKLKKETKEPLKKMRVHKRTKK